jgi:hypothetical protein
MEAVMRTLALTLAFFLVASVAHAQTPSCKVEATEKKLAGAALTSFMKKCQGDAKKTCDTNAAEKKLAGAAKTSFVKKCVADAVGSI